MKKRIVGILLIISSIFFNEKVFATSSYKLAMYPSSTNIKVNQVFSVDFYLDNINEISNGLNTCIAGLVYDNLKLQYVEFEQKNNWRITYGSNIVFENDTPANSRTLIGTFKFKAISSGSANIGISNISCSDGANDYLAANQNTNIGISNLSNNANLNSLTINNGTLTPSFSSSVTSYIATTTSDKITIGGSTADSKASISGLGEKALSYGDNNFTITVTAEDNSTKKYYLTVTRNKVTQNNNTTNNTEKKETTTEATKSNINTLKELEISNIDIDFKSDTLAYSTKVKNDVEEIEIKASATDEKAKVDGIGKQQLKIGNNVFKIVVTAESGVTKTYAITIIREDENGKTTGLSEINDLKALKVKGYTLVFDKDKTKYSIKVNSNVDEITVVATPQDSKAIVAGDGVIKLNESKNKIKLIVTAENGDKKAYTITVTRGDETEDNTKENKSLLIPIIIAVIVIGGIVTAVIVIEKKKKGNSTKKDNKTLNPVKTNNNTSLKDEIKKTPLTENTKEVSKTPINKTDNINEETVKEVQNKQYQEAKKIDVEEEIIDFE